MIRGLRRGAVAVLVGTVPVGALPPGAALSAPSFAHPLGTDDLGRDMLSAIAEGARTSFLVGGLATALALLLGTLLGISAAFGTRLADDVVMRSAEITASISAGRIIPTLTHVTPPLVTQIPNQEPNSSKTVAKQTHPPRELRSAVTP